MALPQGQRDQGAAPGAEHKADAAQDHQKGHNKVDGCKGRLAYKIGHKKSVHHAVDRSKDKHDDGGKGITQKASVSKVV